MALVHDLDLLPDDVFNDIVCGGATDDEVVQLNAARRIAYARRSPGRFSYTTANGFWQWAPHLEKLDDILVDVARGGRFVIISLPVRAGKQLKCTESVRTANRGWVDHGDLQVGDLVYHPSGKSIAVLGNTGVQEPTQYVRMSFSDGTHMDCHPNHEWNVKHRVEKRFRTREARQLFDLKLYSSEFDKRLDKVVERPVYSLPFVDALDGPDQDLPIGPYTVGVWLGDGLRAKQTLTLGPDDADEIIQQLEEPHTEGPPHPQTGVRHINIPDFQTRWRDLGMGYYETAVKRIPDIYMMGSESQRRQLLAGLIDSDGYVDGNGRVQYSGRDKDLVEDVRLLVRSLGYRVGALTRYEDQRSEHEINGHTCDSSGTDWRVSWTPFDGKRQGHLPRKRSGRTRRRERVYITGIEWIGEHSGNCIQVDSEDGLYLAGKDLIPTHNSELTSKTFPCWYLGHNPDKAVVFATYEAGFAQDIGGTCRDKFEAHGETIFSLKVRQDARAKAKWMIDGHRGGMMSIGRGGAFTGRGADVMIIDDPLKNAEEAFSPTIRGHLIDWYTTTIRTRLQAGASIILVLARWHHEDLAGWILEQIDDDWDGDPWEEFRMPMLAEEEDMLLRPVGTPLWPEMFDLDYCERTRKSVGPMTWSSLYQQRPTPQEGGEFQREHWRTGAPPDRKELVKVCRFWDLSAGGNDSDWTVGCLMGITKDNLYYVYDVFRTKGEIAATDRMIREVTEHDCEKHWPRYSAVIEQVPGAGKAVVDRMKRDVLRGLPIRSHPMPGGRGPKDKVTRAAGFIAAQQNEFVYLVNEPGPDGQMIRPKWHEDFKQECGLFPNTDYDDQVDAANGAFQWLVSDRVGSTKVTARTRAGRKVKSRR